jgi:digeranylgeranylglycerophospholipid reductase
MKIAVVGGGPAGLFAAIEAKKNNCVVNLYEKHKIGEGICCAEGIFNSLNVLKKTEETRGFLYDVENVAFKVGNNVTKMKCPIWMMDRETWQKGLSERAQKLGVDIHENSNITIEMLKQLQMENDWVIDASGAPSITCFAYGFYKEYINECTVLYQYNVAGDFSELYKQKNIETTMPMRIPQKNFPYYFWVWPKSEINANVGFGYYKKSSEELLDTKKILNEFLAEQKIDKNNIIRGGGAILPFKKPSINMKDNIIMVGDAMGAVSPLHGGGIDTACISGVLAVKMVLDGKAKDFEKTFFSLMKNKVCFEQLIIDIVHKKGITFVEENIKIIKSAKEGENILNALKLVFSSIKTANAFRKWRNNYLNNSVGFKIEI